jgi:hypothetical protein
MPPIPSNLKYTQQFLHSKLTCFCI